MRHPAPINHPGPATPAMLDTAVDDSLGARVRRLLWRRPWLRLLMTRAFFHAIPHSRRLGLRAAGATTTTIEAELPYRGELIGNPWSGAIHGGAVTTMIDQTSGAAASLSVVPPALVATLDLRVDYLRPARAGRAVRAVAEAYQVGEQVVFVRCTVHDGDPAQPVALGMSTFMRNGPLPLPNPLKRLRRRKTREMKRKEGGNGRLAE